jgi:hypothetical protein
MPVADDVIVKLDANIRGYVSKLDAAAQKWTRTENHIAAGSTRLGALTKAGLLTSGAAVGGFITSLAIGIPMALAAAVKAGLDHASALKEQAQQIGVTTNTLQEYNYIATQVGLTNEQMANGLRFLTRNFGMAQDGVKKPIKAMLDLGFTTKETANIIRMDAGEALPFLAEKFKQIESPAERARIAIALMGRGGMAMMPLLLQGAKGANELREAAHRLGIVLDEAAIQKADEAADKLAELKAVLTARIAGAVAENADAILDLASAVATLAGQMLNGIATARRYYHEISGARINAQIKTGEFLNTMGNSPVNRFTPWGAALRAGQPGRDRNLNVLRQRRAEHERAAGDAAIDEMAANPRLGRGKIRWKEGAGGFLSREVGTEFDGADIAKAVAGRAKGGGAGKSKADELERLRDEALRKAREAAETLRRYTDDLARAEGEFVSVNAELIGTEKARLDARIANIDIERDIANRATQADEDLSEAQKQELILRTNRNAELNKDRERIEFNRKLDEEAAEVVQAGLQNEQDLLRATLDNVTTRKERAEIEKRLVELAFEAERLALLEVTHSATATDAQKAIAEARLRILDKLEAAGKGSVDKANRSPGEVYRDELAAQTANINDEIEQLAVDKFKELGEAMGAAVPKALGLKGAIGDLVAKLAEMAIQQAILLPLMQMLFPGAGGAGGKPGAGNAFGWLTSLFRAGGGPVTGGKGYIVGEKGPEWFQPAQSGHIVPNHQLGGGSGRSVVEVKVFGGEYFDARVHKVTGPVIAKVGMQAAYGGSVMARQSLGKTALHRLEQ